MINIKDIAKAFKKGIRWHNACHAACQLLSAYVIYVSMFYDFSIFSTAEQVDVCFLNSSVI